ncbi:hypothetical protein JR316_0010519 [Psilocybe cubensis]|uniref:Uncharacterized protein n=2 Tax=Psilocybe cubensis TaxID=181762 RepID=A0ACB8GN28_PSICU|nr:hypothetical protein JR316_0010519 [Psilocybe cubensis]KAH9476606.1 hypothetical protein JR316_0010519 [Psilocybe cubensis]
MVNPAVNDSQTESSDRRRKTVTFAEYLASIRDESTQSITTPTSSNRALLLQTTLPFSQQTRPQSSQAPHNAPTKRKATSPGDDPKQRKLSEWAFCQPKKTHSIAKDLTAPSSSITLSKSAKTKKDRTESYIIDPDQMINKTNLTRCYRLKGQYLKDVSLVRVKYEDRKLSKDTVIQGAKTNLYRERDAEFQAWKMHGGRKQFVQYLLDAYLKWETRNSIRKTTFLIPESYSSAFLRLWKRQKPCPKQDPYISFVKAHVESTSDANSQSSTSSINNPEPSKPPKPRKTPWPTVTKSLASENAT